MSDNNPIVNKTFTYAVPDTWRGDTFDLGKTDTHTYKGPRFLTFEIDKDTGRESGWCIWEERDLERPCALDVERVTVDCTLNDENALLCEIANDCGDPEQVNFRFTREWKEQYVAPEGYRHLWEPVEIEPRDIYDEFNITYDFETGKFNLPIKTFDSEVRTDLTWDDIRRVRDKTLADTDGKVSPDMPQSLQDEWFTYRELLRNLPDALAAFPPFIAAQMFPKTPDFAPPPTMDAGNNGKTT